MKRAIIIWGIAILFSVLVVGSALGSVSYFVNQAHATEQRRRDNCISRRNLYDGQVLIVNFGADLFHVSKVERADALAALRKKIHARPEC